MNPDEFLIRERIKHNVAARNNQQNLQAQSILKTPEEKKSFLAAFLGFCILLLSMAIGWAVLYKTPVKPNASPITHRIEENKQVSPDAITKRLDQIDKHMEIWSKRVWLLGVTHNENTNLNRRIQQSQGFTDPGYIMFEDDWKLNRVPSTLQMNEEQKQKLIKEKAPSKIK